MFCQVPLIFSCMKAFVASVCVCHVLPLEFGGSCGMVYNIMINIYILLCYLFLIFGEKRSDRKSGPIGNFLRPENTDFFNVAQCSYFFNIYNIMLFGRQKRTLEHHIIVFFWGTVLMLFIWMENEWSHFDKIIITILLFFFTK